MTFLRFLLSHSVYIFTTILGSYLHATIRQSRLLGQAFHRFLITRARDFVEEMTIRTLKLAKVSGFFKASALFTPNGERVNLNEGRRSVQSYQTVV
jgi:hypothetical protein